MATTTLPGVPVDDTLTVWWVPGGVADPASPKVAELTAATSVDISCYLTTKTFGLKTDANKWERKRRCSSSVFEVNGTLKKTFEDLEYAYDPQAKAGDLTNRAQGALVPMSTGSLVIRRGIAYGTAPIVGQFVQVITGQLGPQNDNSPAEQGDYLMLQGVSPTSDNPKVALA